MVGESAVAKLDRAGQHLAAFHDETTRVAERQGWAVVKQVESDGAEHVWRAQNIGSLPVSLAITAGDCLFNLRSALDHLVYELSLPVGGVERCEFPIFDDPEKFAAKKRNGEPTGVSGLFKMRGMTDDQQAIVESLQPYNAGDADDLVTRATCDYLGVLHDFNNIDKHRALHLVVATLNDYSYAHREGVRIIPGDLALEDGAEVLRVVRERPDANMDVYPTFGAGVAFADGEGVMSSASLLLWSCHRAVKEVLLRVAGIATDEVTPQWANRDLPTIHEDSPPDL